MENTTDALKVVFDLREELRVNPERVRLTQALTLNADKPKLGLRGAHGLFGTPEWWENIESGALPSKRVSGLIQRAYYAGQGGNGPNNMIDVLTASGKTEAVGIYVNNPADVDFFRTGHRTEVIYALDELKQQLASDGSVNYSRVALKMAVSTQPIG